jgi:hypothetical protein
MDDGLNHWIEELNYSNIWSDQISLRRTLRGSTSHLWLPTRKCEGPVRNALIPDPWRRRSISVMLGGGIVTPEPLVRFHLNYQRRMAQRR